MVFDSGNPYCCTVEEWRAPAAEDVGARRRRWTGDLTAINSKCKGSDFSKTPWIYSLHDWTREPLKLHHSSAAPRTPQPIQSPIVHQSGIPAV